MRHVLVTTSAAVAVGATLLTVPVRAEPQAEQEYVVLYEEQAAPDAARAAVRAAGGRVVEENTALGIAMVRTTDRRFLQRVGAASLLEGATTNRVVGALPGSAEKLANSPEKLFGTGAAPRPPKPRPRSGREPLSALQWNLRQIDAERLHRLERGDKRVLVGVMDTGIDGRHPDIAPNFNRKLSRNFTVDVPTDANGKKLDGPCAEEADKSCKDPVDVDENEHGTHVASTIASPLNGKGIAGVAPNVSLVNLRTGQDSGYFFLKPTLDALAYAADKGIDVVNMSYYIDPWAWNCLDNPADSAEDRLQQKTVIEATNRALRYAHRKGVTLISAAGNGQADYSKEITDAASPNFAVTAGQKPRERKVPPSCVSQPSEGEHVISVSATGPSRRKSYFSSYGLGYVLLAAPGGDKLDNKAKKTDDKGGIWAAYPENVARENKRIDAKGKPTVSYVIRQGGAYYLSLQGTSMAAPHAAGVAALIISRFGKPARGGGLTMDPRKVEAKLRASAVPHPCPTPANYTYDGFNSADEKSSTTQKCEGTRARNGFYGVGIVNAARAVR
ncbi:S8 family peptidase [Actinocorallia libanotica]|uniref:S8 family serine peptidase n=1 Tax=Actinocorallia libanotica TaxID=46162 RepID=A0ABN1RU98_9ACTN